MHTLVRTNPEPDAHVGSGMSLPWPTEAILLFQGGQTEAPGSWEPDPWTPQWGQAPAHELCALRSVPATEEPSRQDSHLLATALSPVQIHSVVL